jgi:hypothetical protein
LKYVSLAKTIPANFVKMKDISTIGVSAMITNARSIPARVLTLALSVGCAALMSASAFAVPPGPPAAGQTIEGCDKRVLDAAQAKARAMVVLDYAATEETVDKPDSQLAMTCFNNIAGKAQNGTDGGGSIFSGDLDGHWWAAGGTYPYTKTNPPVWTTDTNYSDLIEDSLNAFYDEFKDADGNDGGTVDYSQTTLADSTTCTEEQDLWGDPPAAAPTPQDGSIRGEGVQGGVPFWDDDAVDGSLPPGAGNDYTQEAQTIDNADLVAAKTARDVLTPGPPGTAGNIEPVTPVFTDPAGTAVTTGAFNACQFLSTAGVATSCGPW